MYETIKAFSQRTNFSYWAVRQMCLQGMIPFVSVGNKKMINVELALKVLEDKAKEG